ncbi:hypothetical protein [Sinanaerobacter sp. ZZT-01]|nr:hypothetical protein [Sinanaerobacter sp. ZZT-01]WRR94213.1 hypothetical protein U5921_03580 [Sinanaerobacter sp. ZZT-01]
MNLWGIFFTFIFCPLLFGLTCLLDTLDTEFSVSKASKEGAVIGND